VRKHGRDSCGRWLWRRVRLRFHVLTLFDFEKYVAAHLCSGRRSGPAVNHWEKLPAAYRFFCRSTELDLSVRNNLNVAYRAVLLNDEPNLRVAGNARCNNSAG